MNFRLKALFKFIIKAYFPFNLFYYSFHLNNFINIHFLLNNSRIFYFSFLIINYFISLNLIAHHLILNLNRFHWLIPIFFLKLNCYFAHKFIYFLNFYYSLISLLSQLTFFLNLILLLNLPLLSLLVFKYFA